MTFLDDWMSSGSTHPSKLARNSVNTNHWDRRRFEKALAEIRELEAERCALLEVAPDTGSRLWADLFAALNKVTPTLAGPETLQARYLINLAVMGQVVDLNEYKRLKSWTEGDTTATALGYIALRQDLERMYDRTRTAQDRALELEQKMAELADAQRNLDDLVAEWAKATDDDTARDYQAEQQTLDDRIAQLRADAEAIAAAIEDELDDQTGELMASLKVSLNHAADNAEREATMMRMLWGSDPGILMRLPAQERLALAKRMDTAEFRRMADLFGPLSRMLDSTQTHQVNDVPEEVYGLAIGRDLSLVLPSELANLATPERAPLFYQAYAEGGLLQYALRGTQKVGRGGIVYLMDNSGSMRYPNPDCERWAKAVGLVLLNLAREQGRAFWAIHFGSANEIKVFDFSGEYSASDIIDFAEFLFFHGA